MVTMAFDNVIRFPEGMRSALGDGDRVRTLGDGRDTVAQKLREALRPMLVAVAADFVARGDTADEREQRTLYYSGDEFLRGHAVRIEGLVAAAWLSAFDTATGTVVKKATLGAVGDLDDLALVDFGDMDEEIATKALAGRLRDGCEDGLFAAGRRLAFLLGREDQSIAVEEILAKAIGAAFKEAAMATPLRIEVLRAIERVAVDGFGPVIHDLNSFLVGRGILPKLRRSYSKSSINKSRVRDSAPSGDIFALLQQLVGGAPAGAMTAATATGGGTLGVGGNANVSVAAMAAAMENAMASLDALQRAAISSGDMPSTGVLREFRGSAVGQSLDHLDAVTADIVATLFDFIFDDPDIADPIKALVARLQIPVLKVAMLDKGFFSSKSHPARRLLDGISRAAARCGPSVGHGDPLFVRITAIIERVQAEFAQDTGLFDTLCSELDAFLQRQEDQADARANEAAPLVAERERREMAAVAADEVLAGWLAVPLPSAVADLLAQEWRALLVRHYLNADDAAWEQAVATAADLVASVGPVPDMPGRKALAARLPMLVKAIHDGLDRVHVAVERRMSLLDCLFSIHAAVLRGAAPVVTTLWPRSPAAAEIVSESVTTDTTTLDCISLVDANNVPVKTIVEESRDEVDGLHRGDWVEFQGEAGPMRYRLSWISPERGILLFTNPESPRALSVAPAALAVQIERGEAAIVPVEPIFDRAVNRALETLKAA